MSVEVSNSSRLLFTDLLSADSVEFWDALVLPDAIPRVDDIQHRVSSGERIDMIAQRYYQDARLWWVIAWANDLEILPTDLKENSLIRVPSTNFVKNELIAKARRQR